MDRCLLAGIVRCVLKQVDDCFGQPVSVADEHLFLVDLHVDVLSAFLRQIRDTLLRLCHNRIQAARLLLKLDGPCLDSCKLQHG